MNLEGIKKQFSPKRKNFLVLGCELDASGNSWGVSLTLTLVLGRDSL